MTVKQIAAKRDVADTRKMNANLFTLDNVSWLSQVLVVIFGGVALIAGKILSDRQSDEKTRQDKEILSLKTGFEQQREKTAEANIRLEELRKSQEPRRLTQQFAEALKGRPTAKAEILYQPDNGEAFNFASAVFGAMKLSKWIVGLPRPISPEDIKKMEGDPEVMNMFPSTMRVGGQPTGISLVANKIDPLPREELTPFNSLLKAFMSDGFGVGGGLDKGMADGEVRIVIGAKP